MYLTEPTNQRIQKSQTTTQSVHSFCSAILFAGGEMQGLEEQKHSLLLWAPSRCSVLNGKGGGKVLNVGVGESHGGPPGTPISGQFCTRNSRNRTGEVLLLQHSLSWRSPSERHLGLPLGPFRGRSLSSPSPPNPPGCLNSPVAHASPYDTLGTSEVLIWAP